MEDKKLVTNADSKGVIQDYYGVVPTSVQDYGILGRTPRFDPIKALKVIRNDPVVRAAAITLVDKVIETGWRLETEEDKPAKEQQKKLKKLLFDRVLRKLVYNLVLYNNGFLEIVKKRGDISDLNVLETSLMRIKAEDNGDIVQYYQELGKPKSNPTWQPDLVVHYKIDDFTSNVWAESNMESLYETVLIKDYVRQWLTWFFGTNQIRPIINIKDANNIKVEELLSFMKGSEKNLSKPLIFQGDVEVKLLQSFANEGKTVLELLNWLDQQILMLMQVPPIAIGMPETSGRSNSVEQFQSMNTRVYSIQKCLEDFTNHDLFKKIGFEDIEFEFGVLDETTRTKVFENVQLMRQSQFSDEAIVEYLESQGVVFETDKILKSPEELAMMNNKQLGTGNEGIKGNKSADAAQSRNRQNSQELSKANQKVMVKNALPDYSKYPYVIDPQ